MVVPCKWPPFARRDGLQERAYLSLRAEWADWRAVGLNDGRGGSCRGQGKQRRSGEVKMEGRSTLDAPAE